MLLVKEVELLEHEPDVQYRFNRACLIFFLIQMPLMIALLILWPKAWLAIGLIYCTEISQWSLVATHLGNMISAISAHNAREAVRNTTTKVDTVADVVDDIQDNVQDVGEVLGVST